MHSAGMHLKGASQGQEVHLLFNLGLYTLPTSTLQFYGVDRTCIYKRYNLPQLA